MICLISHFIIKCKQNLKSIRQISHRNRMEHSLVLISIKKLHCLAMSYSIEIMRLTFYFLVSFDVSTVIYNCSLFLGSFAIYR